MSITFPTNTADVIDEIRGAIGRSITFYVVTVSGCQACTLDPITNTSTDSFCPVFSGVHWIVTLSGAAINAHIIWGNVDSLGWYPGGQTLEGDCRAQIKYTLPNITIVDSVFENQSIYGAYIDVDGKHMEIKNKVLRGVPEINRILIDLKEV